MTLLVDIFPESADSISDFFRTVTVEHYLAHRTHLMVPSSSDRALVDTDLDLVERRRRYTQQIVEQIHYNTEPFDFRYHNGNFIVAGALAKRVRANGTTGNRARNGSWEQLMRTELFEPLGMRSAGFGPPSDGSSSSALWGHNYLQAEDEIVPNNGDNPPALGPAGTVRASLADWAKFIQLHLGSELRGGDVEIDANTLQRLHTPFPRRSASDESYGGAWGIDPSAGPLHIVHAGSNLNWYACVSAYPELGVAFLGATNVEGRVGPSRDDRGRGELAVTSVLDRLEADYFANQGLQPARKSLRKVLPAMGAAH